jgi:hypothetical protein
MARKLRIAWSVGCGIVCLLLIVLWVRSYWRADELTLASRLRLTSIYGCIQHMGPFGRYRFEEDWDYLCWRPSRDEIRAITQTEAMLNDQKALLKRFGLTGRPPSIWQRPVPHWVAVCVAATLTVAPWLKLSIRFSLRALLFATTLGAALLGAIIYAAK